MPVSGSSQCTEDSCPNGAWCDPLTGMCADDPCTGVLCPDDQVCEGGDCFGDMGQGGAGGGSSNGGAGGNAQSTGATPQTGAGGAGQQGGIFGLPTGGGGCACDVGDRGRTGFFWLGGLLLGAVVARRRTRRAP
jgi:hypothetical protein